MKKRIKYVFNKILELIKIVLYVMVVGLVAVLFGEFCGWLFKFFYEILTK